MKAGPKIESEIEAIRAEFSRARREASVESDEQGTLTTATFNFVVYVDDTSVDEWVSERAERIVEKHPARLLVLDADEDCTQRPKYSSHRFGNSTVQGESVRVGICNLTPPQVHAVANALTLPSLPTVLWWSGTAIDDRPNFTSLLDLVDAVIVDSSGGTRDERTIRQLSRYPGRLPDLALNDLAYMRLAPWQDTIAQFFDDPALREEVFSIRRVSITTGSEAEALYLAGWLGSRLGWEACGRAMFCDRRGRQIPFTVEREGEIRRVQRVRLETDDSRYTAALCGRDDRTVQLIVEGRRAHPERLVPLQSIDNASLIERAILEQRTDEIFETALRMVGRLLA